MTLPPAPTHSAITPSTQTAVTIVMAVFALGALIWSLYHWRRSGKPVFLLLFISGGCMTALEAFVDTVGGCWFPRTHSWVAFTAFGRPIPIWLCLAYFFYFGILGGVFWSVLRRQPKANVVWGLFLVGVVGDAIFEITLLHFHTYIYYGGQPLRILRFPFWWAPVNSVIVMVLATIVARFETYFSGWRTLLMIPAALSVSAALNAAAGWPAWLVINSRMPWLPRQLGGLLTWVLAAWFVSLLIKLLPAAEAPAVSSHEPAELLSPGWPPASGSERAARPASLGLLRPPRLARSASLGRFGLPGRRWTLLRNGGLGRAGLRGRGCLNAYRRTGVGWGRTVWVDPRPRAARTASIAWSPGARHALRHNRCD